MNNQVKGHLPTKLQSEKATNIRVNFALGKCEWCWVKEVYCIRGTTGIPLMLVSILAPLDFRTSQLTATLLAEAPWYGMKPGEACSDPGGTNIPVCVGGLGSAGPEGREEESGRAFAISLCFQSSSTNFNLKRKYIVSHPYSPNFPCGGTFPEVACYSKICLPQPQIS